MSGEEFKDELDPYYRGLLHSVIVFLPVVAFLSWWLVRASKKQQAPVDSAPELSALGESKYLRQLFLTEMVLVSAQELTNVRGDLADLKKGEGDERAKLLKRRDQIQPLVEEKLTALYNLLSPIADDMVSCRKEQVEGITDKKSE
jgi:hypothetical protein